MVNLEKLREATKNPLAIIAKLDEKSEVYSRYIAHRQAKKSIDKLLLQEASEYVTIHTQLLEELPAFLEGFTRIYELSLAAFTGAQAKYFGTLRDTLALYSAQYLTEPTEMVTEGNTIKEVRIDVSTSRGIHKAWIERWREPNSIVRSLQITGGEGSRDTLSRANNLNAGHAARSSGGSNASGTPRSQRRRSHHHTSSYDARSASTLRHTLSGTSASKHSSLEPPTNSRRRSVSLIANAETPPGSTGPELRPDSGSIFGSLIRRASHRERRQGSSTSLLDSTPSSSILSNGSSPLIKRPSLKRHKSGMTTPSARSSAAQSIAEDSERHSFGLPRIPTTGTKFLFDNLSLDSQKSSEPPYSAPNGSEPVTYSTVQGMSLSALGLGDTTPPAASDIDAGETWRDSRVLYSCCAVADFNPSEVGDDMRFNGLSFITLIAGDMIE